MSREGSHWACYPESAASWSNSGQAFQILNQPDHRQRIPVTVVEQVSPDSVSLVLRNLVHDEEEPGDFDASLGLPGKERSRIGLTRRPRKSEAFPSPSISSNPTSRT